MPVTQTAKRALRGSQRKEIVNKKRIDTLEGAIRHARQSKKTEEILKAMSLADRGAKNKIIHKNKAARIKSQLSSLLPQKKTVTKTSKPKKAKK